jgi:hypothetical protein
MGWFAACHAPGTRKRQPEEPSKVLWVFTHSVRKWFMPISISPVLIAPMRPG